MMLETARARLEQLGTSWDKRRSAEEWNEFAHGRRPLKSLLAAPLSEARQGTGDLAGRELPRLSRYLAAFADGRIPSRNAGYFPDLPQVRFPGPRQFQVVAALERNIAAIRWEIDQLGAEEFHDEAEKIGRTGSWNVCMLYERGRRIDEHCDRCPTLARILQSPECMRTLSGLIYVSSIAPGTRIEAHVGPTNLRVRCHLGLSIPQHGCRLEVGGEVVSWLQDRCIVFDDSFEHSVWNLSAEHRKVLIVDLWHPTLARRKSPC